MLRTRSRRIVGGAIAVVTGCASLAIDALADDNAALPPLRVTKDFGVTIATARSVGNYFAAGNAICRLVYRASRSPGSDQEPANCGAPATEGSISNLEGLKARNYNVAIVQSDWHHHAYKGIDRFEGRRFETLRSLFSLHQEPFQLLVTKNSQITNWPDLKGRIVNVGGPKAPHRATFNELLKAHGQEQTWFGRAVDVSTAEHFQTLCDGDIDALGVSTGVPSGPITSTSRKCGARVADLDTPEIRRMVAATSYLAPAIIPKSAYPTLTKDITTFGMSATMVTTTEMPDDVAFTLVRIVFEGLEEMKKMNVAFASLEPSRMIRDGLTAPLHPGAEKYYRLRGWLPEPAAALSSPVAVAPVPAARIAATPVSPTPVTSTQAPANKATRKK